MANTRFLNAAQAHRRFDPELVDRLQLGLEQTDSRGDAIVAGFKDWSGMRAVNAWLAGEKDVPDALVELLEPIEQVPAWVDWDRIDRASTAYWRGGFWTTLTLTCASLAAGYQSGAGVKPLVFTGEYRERAYRRSQETARWAVAATSPGGMRRNGAGFAETVRVRVMHAAVRRRLLQSDYWQPDLWGAPINNTDVAYGISGEFSTVPVGAMQDVGIHFTADEREDIQHMWRYIGFVLGVPENLLPATEARAKEIHAIKALTDTPADDDSRMLLRALIEDGVPPDVILPSRFVRIGAKVIPAVLYGFTRRWAGDDVADDLHLPDTSLKHATTVLRPFVQLSELARRVGLRDDTRLAERTLASIRQTLDDGDAPAAVAFERTTATISV